MAEGEVLRIMANGVVLGMVIGVATLAALTVIIAVFIGFDAWRGE